MPAATSRSNASLAFVSERPVLWATNPRSLKCTTGSTDRARTSVRAISSWPSSRASSDSRRLPVGADALEVPDASRWAVRNASR